jgi:tetratricopeptide (TPR) repeat protein
VLVLTLQGYRRARQQAVRLLEGVRKRQRLPAEDQLLLARLYESLGRVPEARALMVELVGKHGDNPRYLAQHVRSLLQHGEIEEAELWLGRMERLPGVRGSFAFTEVKARVLVARRKGEEAARLLKGQARDTSSRLRAAALLEQLGLVRAAEDLHREVVSRTKTPESKLALAQLLARQGRLREALDLCEKVWGKVPAPAAAAACVEVLYAAGADGRQSERVARRVEAALRKDPRSLPLAAHLAAIRHLQGRFEAAEVLYRRALAARGGDPLVLNNLAFLLAFRRGHEAEALRLVERAIDVRGPLPDLLDTRATVHLARGRADLAVKDLREALAESPTAPGYFRLARAYWAQDRQADAVAAFRRAVSLGLREQDLHPLERADYHSLRQAGVRQPEG